MCVTDIHAGVSGNVLINEKGHRLSSYIVWDYAEGRDSYYRSMEVDLTQPPDKVSDIIIPIFVKLMLVDHVVVCSKCDWKWTGKTEVIAVLLFNCKNSGNSCRETLNISGYLWCLCATPQQCWCCVVDDLRAFIRLLSPFANLRL